VALSRDEVTRLIDSAMTAYHRVILMTLYATGIRRAELARLKVSDIDSQRMIIRIAETFIDSTRASFQLRTIPAQIICSR
jgi:integrase